MLHIRYQCWWLPWGYPCVEEEQESSDFCVPAGEAGTLSQQSLVLVRKKKRDAYTWCAHRRSRVWPTEAAGKRLLHLQICIISVTHWQWWVLTGRRRIKARINTLNRIIWVCIQQALQSNYFFLKEWSFFKSLEQGSSMRGCAPFDPNWSVAVIRISLISLGAVEESAPGSG